MSTIRQDPTTKDWIIVAPRRAARPHLAVAVRMADEPSRDPNCPFCPGNEAMTPPEVARVDGPDGWRVRVVPNLYPALDGEGSTEREGVRFFREMAGVGCHEVIVESPRHDARLDEMPLDDLETVLRVWRDRYRELAERQTTGAVVVFKNSGVMAGTSLAHPHSQVVATPVLPPDALRRFDVARAYFNDTGRLLYPDLVAAERAAGERVVAERGRLVTFVPFAAAGPYETWIAPLDPEPSFGGLGDRDVSDLAWSLGAAVGAIRAVGDDPDYNLVVASAPVSEERKPWFSWHLKILPRITMAAGFELGSGIHINPVIPEEAAAALRASVVAAAR